MGEGIRFGLILYCNGHVVITHWKGVVNPVDKLFPVTKMPLTLEAGYQPSTKSIRCFELPFPNHSLEDL